MSDHRAGHDSRQNQYIKSPKYRGILGEMCLTNDRALSQLSSGGKLSPSMEACTAVQTYMFKKDCPKLRIEL